MKWDYKEVKSWIRCYQKTGIMSDGLGEFVCFLIKVKLRERHIRLELADARQHLFLHAMKFLYKIDLRKFKYQTCILRWLHQEITRMNRTDATGTRRRKDSDRIEFVPYTEDDDYTEGMEDGES